MSLGEAFIDIRARTGEFTAQLKALATEIDALQAKASSALSGVSTRSASSTSTGASPAVAAQESIARASTAAADTQVAEAARVQEAAVASYREIAKASRVAADQQVADRLREAQAARTAAFEENKAAGLAADKAIQNYADTAHAARVAALDRVAAENKVADAQFTAASKLSILQAKEAALARQRENVQAKADELATARANRLDDASRIRKMQELTEISKIEKALEKEQAQLERMVTAAGKLGDAEARAFGNIQRAQDALAKATAKQAVADEKAAKAVLDKDAAIERSNATNAESILALDKVSEAERNLAAASKETSRVIAEGAAQDATALRALGAVAEDAAAKIARVNAGGIAPTAAPIAARAVADTGTGAVDSTVAAEKAKIAASNSAIAAINEEKAARRSQLAEAIAAGDDEVKALRAEIVEQDKVAGAAVAAEKVRIAASRSAIAAINEETAALKLRNEAAGGTGPARAVSPVASLNNAAVKQELADTAAAARAAETARVTAAEAADAAIAQASRDLAAERELDFAATARQAEVAAAAIAQASRDTADEAELDFRATALQAERSAAEVAAAWTAAYKEVADRAAVAAAEQIAADRSAAVAAEAAALKTSASLGGGGGGFGKAISKAFSDIPGNIGKAVAGIPKDIFGAVTTSAKFAAIGVLGLGTALAGIGLVAAAKQQAALVSFTAFAPEIAATTDALTGLNNAADEYKTNLDGAQKVGSAFLQQLIALANTSALSQSALQDTSQQLLALGFNGDQTIGIIRDIGNALAASGKTGGGLNDDLKGIVVAFSQIKGAGRLLAQDLNQITTRIPAATRVDVYRKLGENLKIAGADAKDGTKQFADFQKEIQKKAKAGEIGADIAIASITQALEEVPGAAKDAITGLDALGRQNLTLSGSFEALKDNIRNSLAQAFLPVGGDQKNNPAVNIAAQIQKAIPAINTAIAALGVPLAKFTGSVVNVLLKVLPGLAKLIGTVFGGIGSALDSINGKFDGLSAKLSAFGDLLDKVGFGPALLEALKAIGSAIPPILVGIGAIVVEFSPVLSIVSSVARIFVAVLGPAIGGVATILAGLGVVLAPVAEALRKVADLIVAAFGNPVVSAIVKVVAEVATFAAVIVQVGGAIELLVAVLPVLIGLLTAMVVEFVLALGPFELIALAIAGLAIGFEKAWKASETFRDIVVEVLKFVAHSFTGQIQLMLLAVKLLLEGLAKAAGFGGKLNPFHGLADDFQSAADAVGGVNDKINDAIGSFDRLKTVGVDAAQGIDVNLSTAIGNVNEALKGTGLQAISASTDVIELQSILQALPSDITSRIHVVTIQSTIDSNGSLIVGGPDSGQTVHDSEGSRAKGLTPLTAAEKAKIAAAQLPDNTGANLVADALKHLNDASGAAGNSAAKTAADKAAAIKSTFNQAIKDILASLDTDFKKSLETGTRKQIDTALDSLTKKIAAAFKAAGKQRPNKLLDDIQADNTKLKDLADQRDKIATALKAATDRFDAVKSQIQDFASVSSIDLDAIGLGAKKATTALTDLSRLVIVLPANNALTALATQVTKTAAIIKANKGALNLNPTSGPGSGAGSLVDAVLGGSADKFAAALADKLKQIQDFQANVQKLINEGLNKTTIDQVISAGPEAGGVLAQSLAGASKATVDAINATQKGIDDAAKTLGNTAADSLFRAGTQVVSGLIAGLKDQRDEIKAAMKTIANDLVDEIKKALKVHSPSRRMADEVGAHIVPGLLAPIHADGHGLVREAMNSISDTMAAHAPTLAPIGLGELAGLADAEASLQLNAALAPSSIQLLAPPPTSQRVTLGSDGVSDLATAISTARAVKEINAPITQHFHGAAVDPHAAANQLARIVGRLR